MGTFVDKLAPVPFDWGDDAYSSTGSYLTGSLVEEKFNTTMATAEQMLIALMGEDGDAGYLGQLNNSITVANVPAIGDFVVDIPTISISTTERPAPDLSNLDLDFPVFDKTSPTLASLPTIDITGLEPGTQPDSISPTIDWSEIIHDEVIFTNLVTRLINDLQTGATGLDAVVEAELIARAQARQDLIDDKQEQETLEFFSSRGFDLPTGAMQAGIDELANERARNRTELNGKVLIEQAELAQKNSQFAIQMAKDLEAVLRDFTTKRNNNQLDFAKAKALNAISVFSENVRAFIALEQSKVDNIRVQVEYLRGVVESNNGLVSMFKAEGEAYSTIIAGKSARNESVTEIFKAENVGYEAESRVLTAAGQLSIDEYKLKIENADLQLRKAIAEVESAVSSYGTESSLRERVAEAMANIAMQLAASTYGAVNASAGLSYSSGRHQSESFSHTESRSASYGSSNSLNESHSYSEEAL